MTFPTGRGSCWRASMRRGARDRPEGERAGAALGTERRVQGAAPRERADEGGRHVPAAPRRGRTHRPGDRAFRAGGARACEGSGGAVRPGAPERPGEFGVSARRSRAGEFREVHGQGERADLRRHEAGGGEPHNYFGLMGVFIVVEGPEGAGKSTLVRWVAARLAPAGPHGAAGRPAGGTRGAGGGAQGGAPSPPEE